MKRVHMQAPDNFPPEKYTIVGGGILGGVLAYYLFLQNTPMRITILEKNSSISQTTAANGVPSLTPDEGLAVIERGRQFVEQLMVAFNIPGGMRVDVPGVNESQTAKKFLRALLSLGPETEAAVEEALINFGKTSMQYWQKIYDEADSEFRAILKKANFKPCHELTKGMPELNDGYRIDLIMRSDAGERAANEVREYNAMGYKNTLLLTPRAALGLDPYLASFCAQNSIDDNTWKPGVAVVFRPGGCLDTAVFLPLLYDYLSRKMGTYVSNGIEKPCFKIKNDRLVDGIVYNPPATIAGLRVNNELKTNKHNYAQSNFVFCPGENIGSLTRMGLQEPPSTGIAGTSLRLHIPISKQDAIKYADFNHCMEIFCDGFALTWQARIIDAKDGEKEIFIGTAGTKGFHADVRPQLHEEFARNRNLLQLNMINKILPEFISIALNRSTHGVELTQQDLMTLESQGIATRFVGVRSFAADAFPNLGTLYKADGTQLQNAFGMNAAGSAGVSYAPMIVHAANSAFRRGKGELNKCAASIFNNDDPNQDLYAKLGSYRRLNN